MAEIGDIPMHNTKVTAAELAQLDKAFEGVNIAAKAGQHNM